MNSLSEAVAYYKVYDADNREFVGIASVDLPELTKPSVDLKGSGIIGNISAPIELAFDSMTATLNFRTISVSAIQFIAPGKKSFVLVMLNQETDISTLNPEFKGYRILLEGKSKSVKLGSIDTGEATNSTCEMEVYHIKVTENSVDVLEISKLGNIFKINGVNYMDLITEGLLNGGNVTFASLTNAINQANGILNGASSIVSQAGGIVGG